MVVGVAGYYGFRNAGDEAILEAIARELKARGHEVVALSGDPKRTREDHGLRAYHRLNPLALLRADLWLLGGGGLLQDATSALSLTYYLSVLRLARLKGRFPLTPWDLEDLLKEGRVDLEAVEALEDRLAAELSERGAFAALLLLLARKPLGEVFLLADLEAEALEEGLVPEVVRQGVEVLAQPPFLLLKRLSPGEFLLRQSVEEALEDLRAFAEGLAGRLSRARSL